jgi:hypothetical protein
MQPIASNLETLSARAQKVVPMIQDGSDANLYSMLSEEFPYQQSITAGNQPVKLSIAQLDKLAELFKLETGTQGYPGSPLD